MRRGESVEIVMDEGVVEHVRAGRGGWNDSGRHHRRHRYGGLSASRRVRAAVAALAICSVVGCASTSPEEVDVPVADGGTVERSEVQQAAVADSDVTLDEYREGFRRFQSCLSAEGYELHGVTIGDVLIDYGVPSAAVESGAEAQCYGAEFELLDVAWQVKNEDTSYTAEVLNKCLTDNGVVPQSTLAEMTDQLEAAGLKFEECLG